MTVKLYGVHAGVGTHELQDDIELGATQRIEHHIATGKADLRLAHLIEVDRQQLGRTGDIIFVGLAEARRQQANLQRIATMQRAMPDDPATPFEQTGQQPPGL